MKTQASTTLFRGPRTLRIGGAVFLALLPLVSASARLHHSDAWARQQFSKAEQLREALNGRPVDERTRREYQRVIDSYRRVYFGAPTSSKADPSVVATALLTISTPFFKRRRASSEKTSCLAAIINSFSVENVI